MLDWKNRGRVGKHDGYRLIVRRDGDVVRLFTRRGHDWTGRYPAIVKAALRLRARSFTIDGEAAVCGADGVAIGFGIIIANLSCRAPVGVNPGMFLTPGRCSRVQFRPLP
jgi:hypothetical protein